MVLNIFVAGSADSEHLAIASSVIWLAKQKYRKFFNDEIKSILPSEYPKWLNKVCKENNWQHKEDIITWAELGYKSGPKDFIGGLDTFLEYMFEHFHVRKPINREIAEKLANNNLQLIVDDVLQDQSSHQNKTIRYVSIIGAEHQATGILLYQLFQLKYLQDEDGLLITLLDLNKSTTDKLNLVIEDLNDMEGLATDRVKIEIRKEIETAMTGCDLLIVLGNEELKSDHIGKNLRHCYRRYRSLSELVNQYVKQDIRVLFTCMDYICFCATIFAHYAPNINKNLVAAVTSHLGTEPCGYISRASGIPISHMIHHTNVVWGFVGLNHLIDLKNGDIIYNMMRFKNCYPPEELEKMAPKKYQPEFLGEDNWILRRAEYIIESLDYLWIFIGEQKANIHEYYNTKTYISQIRATMDVLDRWYEPCPRKEFISIGICSNQTYGFPDKIYMSQPAIVDPQNKEWKVVPDVPMLKDIINLKQLVVTTLSIVNTISHGEIFKEIIDPQIQELVELHIELKKKKAEEERLELERLEQERLLLEEQEEEEETLLEEEEITEEIEEEEIEMEGEYEPEFIKQEEESTLKEDFSEDNDDEEVEPNEFFDAAYLTAQGKSVIIEQSKAQGLLHQVESTEEKKELFKAISNLKGNSMKDIIIAKRKEEFPPDGVRTFERRPDYKKDPAFKALKPKKFVDIPSLIIQWPFIKQKLQRANVFRNKSRNKTIQLYAQKVDFKVKARERKLENEYNKDRLKEIDILEPEMNPDFNITPYLIKLPHADCSFLFDVSAPQEFSLYEESHPNREFNEGHEAFEDKCFITKMQSVEDLEIGIERKYESYFSS